MGKAGWAGLLGAASDLGKDYMNRQRQIEDEQMRISQEMRKEQAHLVREQALAKFRYDLEEGDREFAKKHTTEREKREAEDKDADRAEKKADREERREREKRQDQRAEETIGLQREQLRKPGEFQQKMDALKQLPEDEQKDALKAILGANRKTGALSDYQEIQVRDKLAKLKDSGVDETNVNEANSLASQVGEPGFSKSIKTPEKKGFFKDTPAEYEYTQGGSAPSKAGGVVTAGQDSGEPGLEKYRSMLKQSGGIIEMSGDSQRVPAAPVEEPAGSMASGGGLSDTESKLDKLETMTVAQLQAVKQGILESGDPAALKSEQGRAILRRINELIQQKSQLVR